jgi:hypothetical protein
MPGEAAIALDVTGPAVRSRAHLKRELENDK